MPSKFEKKWQKKWRDTRLFSRNLDKAKNPYYCLMMFPYPSAEGLHVGNMYAFTGADIYARFMLMRGFDVFEPIGLDGFGIHSENYALAINKHPLSLSKVTEKRFYEQLSMIGNAFDWNRTVETYKSNYYKWTQWLFLVMYKNGLAYRAKADVNWCPSCLTVLADEQVIAGKCERCGTAVVKKQLEQWFFKITKYADRLLKNLEKIDWSETVKTAQRNWIGKSEGVVIKFKITGSGTGASLTASKKRSAKANSSSNLDFRLAQASASTKSQSDLKTKFQAGSVMFLNGGKSGASIEVFTTRPDTIFGATFLVVSPEYPIVASLLNSKFPFDSKLAQGEQIENSKLKEIKDYVEKAKRKSELERKELREKTGLPDEAYAKSGVFTGIYATNPMTGKEIPVWVADYVLMGYGTGAIMGVPGSDIRDYEFAQKFNLPIVKVIASKKGDISSIKGRDDVLEEGYIVNSDQFNGLQAPNPAKSRFIAFLQKRGWGERKVNYHLRDWLISRQRYWGPPIPIIYCDDCGTVPVPEKDLPVELPNVSDFRPKGTGKSPLSTVDAFVNVKCPKCGKVAKRETDVSDTFLDSSWYFLRYPSTEFNDKPFDEARTKKWLPVDMYIGGAEHAVLHLLYARFVTMALHDFGYLNFEEPFSKFRAHGLIIKNGAKMSKSRGNVVNPDDYIKKYGADSLRTYLMFLGPFAEGGDFSDFAVAGVWRFLQRVWVLADLDNLTSRQPDNLSGDSLMMMHKTIEKVTEDIEALKYNTAIAALMEWLNALSRRVHSSQSTVHSQKKSVNREPITVNEFETFLLLLAPFAPHMTEEVWQRVHSQKKSVNREPITDNWSIHLQPWPKWDPKYVKAETVTIVVQVNGRVRDRLLVEAKTPQSEIEKLALKSDKVTKYVGSKKPQKVIFVAGKLINFVV